ncbi:MAG: hypothetical protein HC828_14775 [Blastochloris sp.]|nr:hypothetical protein [Blastochloris sp.]
MRPDDYIPAISNNPAIAAFSLRYNVELLADATLLERFGQGFRPAGWQGAEEPYSRCDPLVRNLQFLVEENFTLDLQILDPARAHEREREPLAI